jgi:hypothetical protein
MNDYLENLNVLVNYSYEILNEHYPTNPKFSVLRLMMSTWNREVLNKINSPCNKGYPICEKIVNLYSNFLTKELGKINSMSNMNNMTNMFNICDSVFAKKNENLQSNLNFNNEEYNGEYDNLSVMSGSTYYSNVRTSGNSHKDSNLTCSLSNSKNSSKSGNNFKNSKFLGEDEEDYATICLIEQ